MVFARRALPEDAPEVLRLRQVMIDAVRPGPPPGVRAGTPEWHAEALEPLRRRLADKDGDFAAFVVDHPDRPGALASLAAGQIEYRIGGADNPHGLNGYVFSVATDPAARRRGYSRACMEAVISWFREQGCGRVDLNASAEGEPLYASLGFVRKPDPSMRLPLRSA
ncbi:GNAT family N-acetyltransferase [Streptomyces sp. UH6]|uniref:GNAT family N-acetyltransferase n=1 Tax=Streptomyces sp. UH6 TaxID=2748379 RepID=UPI0015D4EAD8|nr:GNAT family N-acetyltransferase [Streptomyces sp. UH6]NYV77338.1 GNAT family N-acetyltransferase [Streptomyces sp. UH6]